ncbi:ImmA/IrrE family metallo-endopeptidase [Streptomyces sp. NPDC054861]
MATWQARRLINRDLGLMGANDIAAVIKAIEDKRGKKIVMVEIPLPPEVSAFCVRGQDRDFVVVDSQAGELTQAHATLHELFHLWEEHPAEDGSHDLEMDEETIRVLLPGIKPDAVLKVLTRSHYTKKAELSAETFATSMLQRLHLSARRDESVSSTLAHRSAGV